MRVRSQVMLHPQVEELLGELNASAAAGEKLGWSAAGIRAADGEILELQAPADYLVEVFDLSLAETGLHARVYRPGGGTYPVFIFFHGGGFVVDILGYDRVLRELASRTQTLIVAPALRLSPEHQFPTQIEDALLAARVVAAAETEIECDLGVGIGGDSSGGNLAAVVTRNLTRDGVPVAFQVLIYPLVDATASSASYSQFASGYGFSREKALWYLRQYLPADADPYEARISPFYTGELAGLPPTFIATAECDPLRDEAEVFALKIRAAGNAVVLKRYVGMIHGFFQMTAALDAARELQADIATWLSSTVLRSDWK